ncbi:unnamed protein product [Closterium sp. NIES-53]
MYALSVSAEGDCYLCLLPDPGIEAAALGASESSLLGTAPAEALHTFTLDSVVVRSSLVLSCPAVLSGSLLGIYLPSFSTNLVNSAALQDAMVTTTTPGGQRVSICTCTRMGRHLATFTRRPRSSLYTLATEPPQVAASALVSASGLVAPPCSCRLLLHQTLLWHHRLGHPSLPRLHGMHSRLLVSGLPRSLPPLPPSPAPPCLPCVEGRQRVAPHSSSFPPTTAPLQSLHMDVWGPARVSGQGRERYFLLVVDDYTCYTTVFPLHSKAQPWPCVFLPETLPTLRWTGEVGDATVFRVWGSRAFVRDTSADKLSARAIPRVFLGFPPDAPGWQFYHPTSRLVFPTQDVTPSPWYWPVEVAVGSCAASRGAASGGAQPGRAESEGAGSGGAELGGAEPGGAEPGGAEPEGVEPAGAESEGGGSGGADFWGIASSGGPRTRLRSGAAGAGVSAAGDTGDGGVGVTAGAGGAGGAAAACPGGARTRGIGAAGTGSVGGSGAGGAGAGDPAEPGRARARGTGAGGTRVGGAGASDTGAVEARAGGTGAGGAGAAGAGAGDTRTVDPGVGGAGAGGAVSGGTSAGGTVRPRAFFVPLLQQPPLQPASQMPAPSPYIEQTGGPTERREPESRPASPVRVVRTGHRVPRPCPPPDPGTHAMALRPSSVPLRVPLPPPPVSSLPAVFDPESDLARAASPTVSHLFATIVTDPSFESNAVSALVADLVEFAAACRLDYAMLCDAIICIHVCLPPIMCSLVPESESASPSSVRGECALGADVLEDTQKDLEYLAGAVPHFASMLHAPEGDPDAPDIPTPRSYAEAITGFSQQQGVDYFHTFSPTPKMTTLRVLLHVAAQRDYELHSLDFSTAFLKGSLHEEIWLRRPPGFTGLFLEGTRWSVRWPVYGLRQAPREWHDTLRTTLAALGFTPSTADPSLFLRIDNSLPPFYILVYVDDLVFATADTEALTLVKSELQKRHTYTDLGELQTATENGEQLHGSWRYERPP